MLFIILRQYQILVISITNPIGTTKSNILANVFILDLCVKFKIKKFIFASTIYVHSNQGSFYRVSKQSSELFVEEYNKRYGLNYSIIRFGSVFGPKASKKNGLTRIINTAIKKIKFIIMVLKGQLEDSFTLKMLRGSAEVLKKKYNNKNLLLTGDNSIKISKVLHEVAKIFKIKKRAIYGNQRDKGHYDVNPYSYVPKKMLN